MLKESGGKGDSKWRNFSYGRNLDDVRCPFEADEASQSDGTPQGQEAGSAGSSNSNGQTPSIRMPPLDCGEHAKGCSPEANPKGKLLFAPPTPPAFSSLPGPPSPPVRPGSSPQASESPGLRRPPLPPQAYPPKMQNNAPQSPALFRIDRTVSLDPPIKSNLSFLPQEASENSMPPLNPSRHSWDPSINTPPLPQRRRASGTDSPLSGGGSLTGGSNPLRRASTVSPDLSPALRSLATRSSPLGSEGSNYTPSSVLKSRKTSWSGEDLHRFQNQEVSSERRASSPAWGSSPDSATSSKVVRVGSGDFPLRDRSPPLPESHRLGAELSPKTDQARRVRWLRKAKVRWRLTTVLSGFMILLVLTSLLTQFWALIKVGPPLEAESEVLSEVAETTPVRCVRSAKGGEVACYVPVKERQLQKKLRSEKQTKVRPMYGRLLAMAAHALAELELRSETNSPWFALPAAEGTWVACADEKEPVWRPPPSEKDANGYLVVSAEGGLNQQRIAVCNAVALARHLNLTLVLPDLVPQGSNSEASRFEDIFDVDHFKESLRSDVRIVDRLPEEVSELELATMGSLLDDRDFPREAPLRLYEETLLPTVRANRVVHLRQFVNRLAFDPIPPDIQRLRCFVNFHALRFQPAIQAMGELLMERMRASNAEYDRYRGRKDSQNVTRTLGGSLESLGNRRLLQWQGNLVRSSRLSSEPLADGEGLGRKAFRERLHVVTSRDSSLQIETRRKLLQTDLEARGMSAEQLLEGRRWHMRSWDRGTKVRGGEGDVSKEPFREAGSGKDVSERRSGPDKSGGELEVSEEVRFVALHANLPVQLAAYSMCDFGGPEAEREELRRVRGAHFETLARWERKGKAPDPIIQRKTGQCPLTPEEAALMLAALGVKRRTRIYLTTAAMWGGIDRLTPLRLLYPYFVRKEQLASPKELAPFAGSSQKLAALDLIVSSSADLFAITDPGSQLSSLVAGMRIYRGRGKLPTLWPDKRQLAAALAEHKDVEWHVFAKRVRDSVKGFMEHTTREDGESVYRRPSLKGCMRFEVAPPSADLNTFVREDWRGRESSHRSPEKKSGGGDLSEEEILAIDFSARNDTLADGTDTFGLFKASQEGAEETLQSASSSSDLERD